MIGRMTRFMRWFVGSWSLIRLMLPVHQTAKHSFTQVKRKHLFFRIGVVKHMEASTLVRDESFFVPSRLFSWATRR